jgi:hypothetical protein
MVVLCSDLLIVPQIDVPNCNYMKELEDCGFNHYTYVGSDDSDDAADESVNIFVVSTMLVERLITMHVSFGIIMYQSLP